MESQDRLKNYFLELGKMDGVRFQNRNLGDPAALKGWNWTIPFKDMGTRPEFRWAVGKPLRAVNEQTGDR